MAMRPPKPRTSRSGPSGAHVSRRVKVSVDDARLERWQRAARRMGASLAEWLRAAGDEAAK